MAQLVVLLNNISSPIIKITITGFVTPWVAESNVWDAATYLFWLIFRTRQFGILKFMKCFFRPQLNIKGLKDVIEATLTRVVLCVIRMAYRCVRDKNGTQDLDYHTPIIPTKTSLRLILHPISNVCQVVLKLARHKEHKITHILVNFGYSKSSITFNYPKLQGTLKNQRTQIKSLGVEVHDAHATQEILEVA